MPRFLPPLLVVLIPLVGVSAAQLFLAVVAPLMMDAAGVDPTAYGWVAGACGLGSVWFYMSNHAITPALGPVRTLQMGVGVLLIGVGLCQSAMFPLILLGALLIGFGYSSSTPAGSQIVADHAPREYWATLFSLRQAGVPLGGMIAGALGGWLLTDVSWRTAFTVIAVITACLALPLLLAPGSYNESRPRRAFRIGSVFDPSNLLRPFHALRLAPGLPRLVLVCIGFAVVQSAVFSFFVIYLHDGLGYSLALSGTLFAVLQGASVLGRIVFGLVADRVGSPRPVLMVLAASSSLSSLLLASLGPALPFPLLIGAALAVGLSVATWNGLYLAEAASLAPPEAVSEVTAGTTFFVFLTYTVTPPLFGVLIKTFGYPSAFLAAAVAVAVSAVILLLGRKESRAPRPGEA